MQIVRNDLLIDEQNLSTSKSAVVDLSQLFGVAIQFVYVKDGMDPLSAIIKLQVSNDGDNWNDLQGATGTISASGNMLFNLRDPFFKWLKCLYVPSSGTVDLQVRISADDGKQ